MGRAGQSNGDRREPAVLLGARFRAARLDRGLTMEQLAEQAGLTKSFISRLERDEVSPSVASLVGLCQALNVRVGDMFDRPPTSLVRAGEGAPLRFGPDGLVEFRLTPGTQRLVDIYLAVAEPGMVSSDVLYGHDTEVETAHVLSGMIELVVNDEVVQLRKGDTFTFSGREPHRWSNPSDAQVAEVLWVFAPTL